MTQDIQTVEEGDLFRDNDPRVGRRVVRVEEIAGLLGKARVVTVENSISPRTIGRSTYVKLERLERGRNTTTGYTKVDR